jgi:hypothetical protein
LEQLIRDKNFIVKALARKLFSSLLPEIIHLQTAAQKILSDLEPVLS